MADQKRQQFAEAVVAVMDGVQHLAREVDRLIVGLREGLKEEPAALAQVRGTLGKSGKDSSRVSLRHDYGLLFAASSESEDSTDELDEEEIDEDEAPQGKKAKKTEIVAGESLLAVRIVLYSHRRQESFEPQVEHAVMRRWRVGAAAFDPALRFAIDRYMLRRIPRALGDAPSDQAGPLSTNAAVKASSGKKLAGAKGDRRLRAELPVGIRRTPLFSLDSADALDAFVRELKATWAEANTP